MIIEALKTMGLGMAGIFVVMGIIIASIAVIRRLFKSNGDSEKS